MTAVVSIIVNDENGSSSVSDVSVDDVAAYIERVERLFIEESIFFGPVNINFLVFFPDTGEVDGFTRYYYNRVHVETV